MKVTNKPAVTEMRVIEEEAVLVEFTPLQAKIVGALLANVMCGSLRRAGFDEDQCSQQLGYDWRNDYDRGLLVNLRAGMKLDPEGDNGVAFEVRFP